MATTETMRRWARRLSLLGLVSALSVGGCDCSDTSSAIFIIQPSDGAQITLADDLDGDPTNGIQFDVVANTFEIPNGEELDLRIDGDVVATAPVDGSSNRVTFPHVTLPAGQIELLVCDDDCDVQSNRIRVRVEVECPSVDFITPAPPAMGEDVLVLGPEDDTSGEPCGASFSTDFEVVTSAAAGLPIQLEVNGNIAASTTVEGTIVHFSDVVLDRRGADDPNTVRVVVESQAGVACPLTYPTPIMVDCEGVSCVITAPQPEGGLLGVGDDADGDPTNGLQTEAEVATGIRAVGEPVQLLTNEVPRATATVQAEGDEGIATFPLELQEGEHVAQAICRDAVGNETHSAEVHWTVDLTPCEVSIDQIAGYDASLPALDRVITPDDDLDEDQAGTQVAMSGSVSGEGCEDLRVGVCDATDPSLEGVELTPLAQEGSYERTVTLGTDPTQHVCAQARDAAGNLSVLEPVQVQFASDAPMVQVASPKDGDRVNADGGTFEVDGEEREYIVDLDPSTTRCEAAFEVLCGDTRGTVRIIHQTSSGDVVLTDDVACEPATGLPSGFEGVAQFDSVALPTLSGTPFTAVAEHRVGTVTPGLSAPVELRADCNAPRLVLVTPSTCPAVLDPNGDDLVFDIVAATSADDVQDPAELRIFQGTGSEDPPLTSLEAPFEQLSVSSFRAAFEDVSFASAGDYYFDVCAYDDLHNQGCVDCEVTVGDLPAIEFLEPVAGEVYGADDDCDPGNDSFQIQVTANTDVADGSHGRVLTGSQGQPGAGEQEVSVAGGAVSVCIDAPQGSDVPIEVQVTHPDSGLTASKTIHVDVDSMPPTEPIDDLAMVDPQPELPRHSVKLEWTAVPDGDGGALERYELRCADEPISTESDWDAAEARSFDPEVTPVAPGDPPATQSGTATGFQPGATYHCTLRAFDLAGEMTPLGNSVEVLPQALRSFVIRAEGSNILGTSVKSVGDVNGDGLDDVLIGGRGEAYLYFGRGDAVMDGAQVTPDVTFRGETSDEFGRVIAPLGDVNGDGRPDFAISGYRTNDGGAVYVFHGRASDEPWEALIDVAGPTCQASTCMLMDDGADGSGVDQSAFFGFSMAGVGDFNGDGVADIAIGAPGTHDNVGRVYLLVGGQFDEGETVSIPKDRVDGWALEPDPAVDFRFGWEMTGLGPAVGGDPLADLAFSATGGAGTFGALYIFRGRVLGDEGLQVLDMPSAITTGSVLEVERASFGNYGFQVANVGDLDGDGFVEVAVRHPGREHVTIFKGALGGYSDDDVIVVQNDSADPSGDQFGRSIAEGMVPGLRDSGDVDGDGLDDLFVGSRDDGTLNRGVAQLFSGSAPLPSPWPRSSTDMTLDPDTDEHAAHRTVGFAGDVDADGSMDLAVGDPEYGDGEGQVIIYY